MNRGPFVLFLALTLFCCRCERRAPKAAAELPSQTTLNRAAKATPDPSTLVLVHSWSGRTERLGRELGNMLGARVVAFHDPPVAGAEAASPLLAEALPTISLQGVRTVFLGFPVWGEAPSPYVTKLVESLRFDGIRVVPFYSFIHAIRPEKLDELSATIKTRGGSVLPELAFLIPLAIADAELDGRAQRALLSRPELWSESVETLTSSCEGRGERDGAVLCGVPAGITWVGDVGADVPLGARPPRRVRVEAFEIDRAEVTVGQYAACVSAGGCKAIDFTQSFCSELLSGSDHDALALPCATWVSADSYCRWAGMRLPTEAEWIRSSRGEGLRAYPWGDEFSGTGAPVRGNFGEKRGVGFPAYSTVAVDRVWPSDGFKGLAAPCTFPAGNSPLGLCDLSGNVAEWVNAEGSAPVAKGGSWLDGEAGPLRIGSFAELPPVFARDIGIYVTGVRCARGAP